MRMDGRTDNVKTVYPPYNFVIAKGGGGGGYNAHNFTELYTKLFSQGGSFFLS